MNPQEQVAALAQAQQRFNWRNVKAFLCRYHGVTDPSEIRPYGGMPDAHSFMRPVQLCVESTLTDAQFSFDRTAEEQCVSRAIVPSADALPRVKAKRPDTGAELADDINRVYVFSIITRHVKSTVPIHVAVRLNFYHASLPDTVRERDAINAAAGGIRGEYTTIEGCTNAAGIDLAVAPLPRLDFGTSNEFCVATMALIDETNLMNGIVPIPHEVCELLGLPVYKEHGWEPVLTPEALEQELRKVDRFDSPEQRAEAIGYIRAAFNARVAQLGAARAAAVAAQKTVSSYVAVPANHVLAWGLCSADFAVEHELPVTPFEFVHKGIAVLLYFLVDNVSFARITKLVREAWMSKIDARPLSSVAFEFLPKVASGADRARMYPDVPAEVREVRGSIAMRSYISYQVAPVLSAVQRAQLAPVRHPKFPPSGRFVRGPGGAAEIDAAVREKIMQ